MTYKLYIQFFLQAVLDKEITPHSDQASRSLRKSTGHTENTVTY